MHLHIGKNNVLGRTFIKFGHNVHVIAHSELKKLDISKFKKISISAFNPKLKQCLLSKGDDLVDTLIAKSNGKCEVIYFSTARCLQRDVPKRHAIYIKNKQLIVKKLRDNFKKVSVIYLPNVIPLQKQDKSLFIDCFISNLNNDVVSFDCSENSSWNFIDPISLVKWLERDRQLSDESLVVNQEFITVSDLIQFAKDFRPLTKLKISVGSKKIHYPSKMDLLVDTIELSNSLEANKMDWIKNRISNNYE